MQTLTGDITYNAKVERHGHGYRARVLFDFDGAAATEYGETRRHQNAAYKDINAILQDMRGL